MTNPGGRIRKFSLRSKRPAQVHQRVRDYKRLKKPLETIYELSHQLRRSAKEAIFWTRCEFNY